MSLTTGIRSIIKGIIMLLKETFAIKAKKIRKIISKSNSQDRESMPGTGIQSMISMMPAKTNKTTPLGEKRISLGIFWNHFPGDFFF